LVYLMSGAYVAKPAAVAASGLPPGWTAGWAFPGPWPPGYVPTLSYNLSTGATYLPGNTHDASVTLRDQTTYATEQPDNDINWTAAIEGTPVQLKFSGDAEWSDSLSSTHGAVGDYYGAEPTLLFNVSAAQEGQIITLTAVSTPYDNLTDIEATASAEIEVVVSYTWTARLDFTCVFGGGGSANYLQQPSIRAANGASVTQRAYAQIGNHWFIGDMWGSDVDGDLTVTQVSTYVGRIEVDIMEESVYQVRIDNQSSPNSTVVDYTFTIYRNGEEYATYTKEKTFTEPWDPPGDVGEVWSWLSIDGETGEVTVIDSMLSESASMGVWP
jgi:hypothetical protein